jgi:small conductance mechanosensitive channel
MDNVSVTVQDTMPLLKGILYAILILGAGWIASKWANRLVVGGFRRKKLDEALGRFLAGIAQYTVLAAALITALGAVGIETTSLVALLASAGLAVGLALQGSLSNFASGVMILFFRPFNLGDKITAGGHTGAVEDIGILVTTMVNYDAEVMIVPNSAVMGGPIINHSRKDKIRVNIAVGVAYGADANEVIEILKKAAASCDLALDEPATNAYFLELGASSLDFMVQAWCIPDNWVQIQHDVRKACYEALNEAGIEIPFQQIVIHNAEADAAA